MAEEVLKEDERALARHGLSMQIIASDKSSVSDGRHVICNVLNLEDVIMDHDLLSYYEKTRALRFLMKYLQEQHPDGRWTLMLNGPGMTTRPTFHIHGVLPEAPGQVLRFVFNASNFLTRLKAMRYPADELPLLIEELEKNLK